MEAKFIIEKFTEDSDPISDMGIGMEAEINKFLSEKEDFRKKYMYSKKDLLWICAYFGKTDFARYLIQKGGDVHYKEDRALRWAVRNEHAETVKLLLDAGANIHVWNNEILYYKDNIHNQDLIKIINDHIAKEKKGLVKESLFEKFTEDSDPIKDMGIGGINLYDKALSMCGTEYLPNEIIHKKKLSRWVEYFKSLVGKTISGNFRIGEYEKRLSKKKFFRTFKISHVDSFSSPEQRREIYVRDTNNKSYYLERDEVYNIK